MKAYAINGSTYHSPYDAARAILAGASTRHPVASEPISCCLHCGSRIAPSRVLTETRCSSCGQWTK